ncbi:MAG: type II toxin-antitoxin system HicB family antitoxin [Firmicutes bacterium]|nr:type II toxin-antitoxin system HicB family antitoxin [Bacillota bacterium]
MKKASGSFSVDPVILEQDEDEKFVITCPVLEGCHSQGNTFEEAVNNIREAIELCLEEKANG